MSLAAASYCRIAGSSGKTAAPRSVSTPPHLLGAGRQANSRFYPQPRRRTPQRRPGHGIRFDGRGWPTANSGGHFHPLHPAGHPAAGEYFAPALAAGPNLGTNLRFTEAGRPLRAGEHRPSAGRWVMTWRCWADYSEAMGHAGAIVRHPNGLFEGAVRSAQQRRRRRLLGDEHDP
ncbi:Uncharacterised protein [Raoultella planticola]|uniref:Uncharacterized protein n=1 Tax=Raoultella planticola TaxID=575 RepID=A0A485A6F5_RAOPL|nr:Uncharacterised protein [Raoultella planticola]